MRRTISLDGPGWQIRSHPGTDAALAAAARPSSRSAPDWLPGRVPGTVLDDLWQAGEIPDPEVERNSRLAEWVPQRAWAYRRSLEAPRLEAEERAWLRFSGLDHAGHVWLDEELIESHAGMFVPFEIDVTDRLRAASSGVHELSVVIEPAPADEPQVGRTSRVRIHKARMNYGWDFCPPTIHQGLWQSVDLVTAGRVRIGDVWARAALDPDLRNGSVRVRVTLDVAVAGAIRVLAALEGRPETATSVDVEVDLAGASPTIEADLVLEVTDPGLWWPNGSGEQHLHRLVVRVEDAGSLADERDLAIGFRRIERVPNAGAREDARPWTFVVNGRPTPIQGWNWAPLDARYGVPRPAKLAHLIRLARASHANLLRVWGGGLIETEAFYNACDRAGLLVWQEFSQSSSGLDNEPATDAAYVEAIAAEAERIVPLRRNHPSLAIWCGGNELAAADGRPLDDEAPVLAALRDVVARLDPDRPWLPTSPSGPRFHNRLADIEADPDGLHDVHGPWEHQGLTAQNALYDRGTSLFSSEFGVEGMANRRQADRLIAPEHRWPADRSNPVYRHLGDWWNNAELVQASFGGRLEDVETMRRASQQLQADGLRYAVEANRRRWPRNSGTIPWQLAESYPNAWCTAVVDHLGDPKPAWHAVRRAWAPFLVCASFAAPVLSGTRRFEWTAWASARSSVPGARIRQRIRRLDGSIVDETRASLTVGPERSVAAAPSRVALREADGAFVLLELELLGADDDHSSLATNRYVIAQGNDLAGLLDLQAASLGVDVEREVDRWRVHLEHRAGPAALGLQVTDARSPTEAGWAEIEDSGLELLPGEMRQVVVDWADAPTEGRALRIHGWNVAESVVR
jgi:beta-mannosidase